MAREVPGRGLENTLVEAWGTGGRNGYEGKGERILK